ncbi:MAG: serine hydrolase domain-containing protein [Acidobacteriota bacterium]
MPAASGDHHWGGPDCADSETFRQIVEAAAAASPAAALFDDVRGSSAPGYSVAILQAGCGAFSFAIGHRDVERSKAMTPRTSHHLGSLTKVLTGVIVVRLAALGAFGLEGLDAPVDRWFDERELTLLTVGSDPASPRCPTDLFALGRTSGAFEPAQGTCPDLGTITLRQLLNGNHGLYDVVNELDRNQNLTPDNAELIIGSLLDALGVPRLVAPPGTDTPFDLLTVHGLLAAPDATPGGGSLTDFETSFGNTGHTLAGVIAERATGVSYDLLLSWAINWPLGLRPPMRSLLAPPRPERQIAREYAVVSGSDLFGIPEDGLGVFPQVFIEGHPANNTYRLDAYLGLAGASGWGISTPAAYARFLASLVEGRLLDPAEQSLFDQSFVPIDDLPGVEHGFGLFRFDDPEFGPGFAKSGQTTGSACQALYFADHRTTVVACRNAADAFLGQALPPSAAPVGDLARQLVAAADAPR